MIVCRRDNTNRSRDANCLWHPKRPLETHVGSLGGPRGGAAALVCILLVGCLDQTAGAGLASAEVSGELKVWHRITLTFNGPESSEEATPNPFLDYRLTVTFTRGAKTLVIPGYYAADGRAAESGATAGRKWRVHFVLDDRGRWTWRASFRAGARIAVDPGPDAGKPVAFDGAVGQFTIGPTDKKGRDFRGKGMLRYVGAHYLRFAGTGDYFLKGGADSPENLLGYWEFDGTRDIGSRRRKPGLIDGLHRFRPHVKHWRPGDPTWRDGKGKGIIGGLNYLSEKGVNSVYFLTYNVDGGDGKDTWMWAEPRERLRFDCSKLDQWETVFSHMDARGIQLHLVTQEAENDRRLGGSGAFNDVRRLYYRELVARFSHHLAVIWNLGEENNNSVPQRKAFAAAIRRLDPYDHPITVHTHYGRAWTFYDRLLGDTHFEATSIQGDASNYNALAIALRRRSAKAGRKWAVYGDEQGPPVNAKLANLDTLRKAALWGNLIGGGAGVEWYFGYQGTFGDLQSDDWTVAEPLWDMTRHALTFFRKYLPFADMEPANQLVSGKGNMCFAKVGGVYAVYLPAGGQANLAVPAGTFAVRWYNPRDGGALIPGTVKSIRGPGRLSIGRPPVDPDEDWVALVEGPDPPRR